MSELPSLMRCDRTISSRRQMIPAVFETLGAPRRVRHSCHTLGVPIPQTQNVGPPVELDECQLTYTGGFTIGKNDTTLTADVVEIQVLDADGEVIGTIRDVGTSSPGVGFGFTG